MITVDPGHFHAALIQKEMYAGVAARTAVYAPLGTDLAGHLGRVARFNQRPKNPTSWEAEIHASADFRERMKKEAPGNIVVLSGRNCAKIGYIRAALEAGQNVLSDKPWIIRAADFPALEEALAIAESKGLIAYDIMTERYEITTMLQRALVNDPEVFGALVEGSEQDPAVYMESVHHLLKLVAGVPNLRPAWYFDIEQQGEALADVGTHLVDLVQWTLFPEQVLDYRKDIHMVSARRWPTSITAEQFRQVTGEPGPALDYYCNTQVTYALRGFHTKLDVLWRWEAPAGAGDTHVAIFRGSKSQVEIRQGVEENYQPELYVVTDDAAARKALEQRAAALAVEFPGVGLEPQAGRVRVTIPDVYRVGHEAHFAQVANRFFEYLRNPASFPAWENPGMLAKYSVSTGGVALSHAAGA